MKIPQLNCITEDDKNKQGSISAALFCLVGRIGQMSNQFIDDLKGISDSYVYKSNLWFYKFGQFTKHCITDNL
jgi:hypothetical protein